MATSESKILIVDDTPENIDVLDNMLRDMYETSVAINGRQAIKLTKKIIPDLILLDIMMPEMDGFETCRQIKEDKHLRAIPVIFLTAKDSAEDIVKGFQLGAVDYVTKPFNLAELKARIMTHLDLKMSHEKIARQKQAYMELVHILCHDLANPVGAMREFCKLALSGDVDFQYALDISRKMADQSLDIINLVRRMGRLDEKGIQLEPVNLLMAINTSLKTLQTQIAKKQIKIAVNISASVNVWAESDSLSSSVLNNILTNAIKFSNDHSAVDIDCEEKDGKIFVTLKDNGVGMPEKIKEKLFQVNAQTSRPGLNGEKGTGFGMPLVKKFMLHYGGAISVESNDISDSTEQHGTIVTLDFIGGTLPNPA
ncbi:MAG: hybrid sensor histidine kinase/response regulator [Candidatus Electrothrix sp. AR4]|nr:hybrid sensor histidine kinase/response regulator [Candidatus Electrothrix sp. AR4]